MSTLETVQDVQTLEINLLPTNGADNRPFKNVDGIKFLNHQGGCGGTRQDAATLGALLAAYADHPNVGGITVLSLGCQNLQVNDFVWKGLNQFYLWQADVPNLADDRFSSQEELNSFLNNYNSPEDLFQDLLNKPISKYPKGQAIDR